MYKSLIKRIVAINNKFIATTTVISGAIISVFFMPRIVNSLQEMYSKLNNDSVKSAVSFLTDINILLSTFNWIIYISLFILIISIIVIIIKLTYKDEEIINKVIIGHSSMSKVQFNVKTDCNYTVEELNLIDNMKDIGTNYEQIKFGINKQDKFIDEFKLNIDNEHKYGYMGIAHTPLILRIGNQIGDEVRFSFYHKERESDVFKELSNNNNFKNIKISTKVLDKESKELIVGLSTTNPIKYEELKVLKPDYKNILMFETEELGYDVITSEKQVDFYVKYMMKEIKQVVKDKNITKIHMVISSSVVMTFALGQAISKNHDPEVIIYNFELRNPRKYTWGIKLFENCNDCLVITSD